MKFIHTLIISLTVISISACKCSKNNSANAVKPTTENSTQSSSNTQTTSSTVPGKDSTDQNKLQTDITYRVIVSFISIGAGIDPDAHPALDAFVQQYMDTTSKKIVYQAQPWGREGEMDICFMLDNLSAEEQVNFINGLKTAFLKRELVRIEEYKKTKYRR